MRPHFKITIKEYGREKPIETSYDGDVNHQFLIDHFGLNNPDVEWYGIDIQDPKEDKQ